MSALDAILQDIEALPPAYQAIIAQRLQRLPHGSIVAYDVSLDDYLENYAADYCEYVEGMVIQLTPAELRHNDLTGYLYSLLGAYFELRPVGRVILQPFVLRLAAFPNRRREPDLMVVLDSNPHELTSTAMNGPADIVIEIVSEESTERDHGDKFREYEQGGVPEYWIIDGLHRESRFFRLSDAGRYIGQTPDADSFYRTPTLPGLALHIATLWEEKLPGPGATFREVEAQLASAED